MDNFEVIETENGEQITKTDPDGTVWSIPTDPANSDYAEYLAQLEGEQPEAIEEE
jgi:hypothetical protein